MYTSCKHDHIRLLQCKFGTLAQQIYIDKSYSLKRDTCLIDSAKAVHYMLNILRCYKTFDDELTYAYKFTVTRTDTSSITIQIDVGAETFTYTGTGTADEIVSYFKSQINDNTQSPIDYSAEIDEGVLYVYTTSDSASYSDTHTIAINSQIVNGTNSVSVSSLQNNENEITNVWNCLSGDELCEVLDGIYCLLPEKCN